MYSLSYIIKYILGLVSSSETIKNGNKIEQLTDEEIEAYVGGDSYLNYFYKKLPPKIGFHKETTIQPWSNFNNGKLTITNLPLFLGGYYTKFSGSVTLSSSNPYCILSREKYSKTVTISATANTDGVNNLDAICILKLNGSTPEYQTINNYPK